MPLWWEKERKWYTQFSLVSAFAREGHLPVFLKNSILLFLLHSIGKKSTLCFPLVFGSHWQQRHHHICREVGHELNPGELDYLLSKIYIWRGSYWRISRENATKLFFWKKSVRFQRESSNKVGLYCGYVLTSNVLRENIPDNKKQLSIRWIVVWLPTFPNFRSGFFRLRVALWLIWLFE